MTTEVIQNTAAPEATTVTENTTVAAPVTEVPASDILSMVSEDLRTVKSLEKFKGKDVNELAKSYTNLESLIGKKVSELPEDVVKQYLKVPTKPEEYKLADEAKNIINGKLLEVGLKANVSQEQMKELTDALVEIQRSEMAVAEEEANKLIESGKKELEAEFGIALEKRLDAVKKIMTQFGDPALHDELAKTGLLHNAKFVKFLDKITQEALSVKMVGSDFVAQQSLTPTEAKALINKKYADKEFNEAYFDSFHPGHKNAVAEMNRLIEFVA